MRWIWFAGLLASAGWALDGCLRDAPASLSKSEKAALCSGAGAGAADCARAALRKRLGAQHTVALCAAASTAAPGECASAFPPAADDAEKVALCARAVPGLEKEPAACVKALAAAGALDAATRTAVCGTARSDAPAKCFVALSKKRTDLGVDDVVRLCAPTASEACALSKHLKNAAPNVVVELCAGGGTEAAAQCFSRAPMQFEAAAAARLCAGADAVTLPVVLACAADLAKRAKKEDVTARAAAFCKKGGSLPCVAESGALPLADALDLCAGGGRAAPAERTPSKAAKATKTPQPAAETGASAAKCHHAAKKARLGDQASQLCRGALSAAPGECAVLAPYTMDAESKVVLCHNLGAIDAPPEVAKQHAKRRAECAAEALRQYGSAQANYAEAAALCRGAIDSGPPDCVGHARRPLAGAFGARDVDALCRGAVAAAAQAPVRCASQVLRDAKLRRRTVDAQTIAALCAAVDGNALAAAIADCARSSGNLHKDALQRLCRARGRPAAQIDAAAACFAATDSRLASLDAEARAALCGTAPVEAPHGPAKCAQRASVAEAGLSAAQVLELCAGARDATPAHCAIFRRIGGSGDAGRFRRSADDCRRATSVASSLDVAELTYEGKAEAHRRLRRREKIRCTLRVLDQFGRFLEGDSRTVVVASMALQGSNGATLDGRKSAVARAGVVTLDELSFSKPGNFTLRFRLAADPAAAADDAAPHGAAAFVHVSPDADFGFDSPAGRCAFALFSSAQSHVDGGLDGDDAGGAAAAFATVGVRLGAGALARPATFRCRERLAEAGFVVADGWGGATWVWYRAGLVAIEASLLLPEAAARAFRPAVPTAATALHAVLGVEPGATAKQVRKAYHRLSLQWHPDRWVGFPHYLEHVNRIFDIVSDAHQQLTNETKSQPADAANDL
ncbi:hypothetical protein M885DRAFT_531439 [Pelagophyceae sp. CCMP2097]|nr:hypothetical protein M885DRAFT_531439 [Pelagophyceae sp. CCMP2097]